MTMAYIVLMTLRGAGVHSATGGLRRVISPRSEISVPLQGGFILAKQIMGRMASNPWTSEESDLHCTMMVAALKAGRLENQNNTIPFTGWTEEKRKLLDERYARELRRLAELGFH